ncbi:hypothetical protein BN3087_380018 [Sulfurovum sp. enrichment culture clone C5]|uniref:Uncharacterized protein n=1 Tax=Sulfurovum sp. enrichment culture clone C5 TaxID=497650 RepID=A0A0S4XN61_9BACT|nr:hypothetical protein BN3087_380018 [Sulfurovum sp. enrichment culture clone C5]
MSFGLLREYNFDLRPSGYEPDEHLSKIQDFIDYNLLNILPPPLVKVQMRECL